MKLKKHKKMEKGVPNSIPQILTSIEALSHLCGVAFVRTFLFNPRVCFSRGKVRMCKRNHSHQFFNSPCLVGHDKWLSKVSATRKFYYHFPSAKKNYPINTQVNQLLYLIKSSNFSSLIKTNNFSTDFNFTS